MNSESYSVRVITQTGDDVELQNVEASVTFPEPAIYQGADGTGGRVLKGGTLRLIAPEFKGWASAELIYLINDETGEESVYEVSRNFSYPASTGGELVYPVKPRI
ncbi:hypothetical protein [Pseudomonas corrugata]|uniref:hypothetical protein n=1 Tax=Pseudomonas corrugata TaxID=47879 RepID=UPI0015862026|nr:hypothetical protein [Pseudomonas corrugata]MCI0993455.1 hypothetical protein [Pseudomonas corrugata]NUT69119.1 hypothetical protein [Pseudomonas corrugata]